MKTIKETLELALEALTETLAMTSHAEILKRKAITALREALTSVPDWASEAIEQLAPVQQEPVAWLKVIATPGGWWKFVEAKPNEKGAKPVYTSPPAQRKPLTDDQIMAIGKELGLKCRLGGNPNIDFDYARAIEAAHGIYAPAELKENT